MPFRILIADDDLHTRRILDTVLAREPSLQGPEILAVNDGMQAISSLESFAPDLVISDLRMPRMDGFAFARALRQHPAGATVPLLVTSAIYKDHAQISDLERETNAKFYSKPYQLRDMVRAVLRILVDPSRLRRDREPTAERPAAPPLQGSLDERGLPRLLFELFDIQATGILALSRARLRKEVFVLHGHPIGAASNLRSETLGQLLVARGAIEPSVLAEAMELSKDGKDRLGAVLIDRGWMKESDVMNHLAAQVRLKIVNALRWREGTYRFVPGDSFSGRMTHLSVDSPRLVLSGLRRSARPDEIAAVAATVDSRLVLGARFSRHRQAFVRVFGEALLTLLGSRPRVSELARHGEKEVLAQYEALILTGLGTLASESAQPPGPGSGPFASPEDSGREALYQDLFGEVEDHQLADLARRSPSHGLSIEDSGLFALSEPAARPGTAAFEPRDPAALAARDALLRDYLSLHARNHYDRLGVSPTASQSDIARAFETRCDALRPDRFAGVDLGRDYSRLEEIQAALQASYDVLSDPGRRALYDRALSPMPPQMPPTLPIYQAEGSFREGMRLLNAEQPSEAVVRLSQAVQSAPEQADYHAMLGWARFQARDRSLPPGEAAGWARGALEQALAADPDHAGAHEFWGRISFVLGEDEDAINHLERALHADPTRDEALKTLQAACLRTRQHERLVGQLRSLIAQLGESRTAPLWHDLGLLLRDQIGDKQGARIALESYLRLVPDDTAARKMVERLAAPSPPPSDSGRHEALALRAAWRASAANHDALVALFRLHRDANRPDAALAAASALVASGLDDPDVVAFVKRYRPRFLQRAITHLAWGQFDAIRHADDDRDLAALFTRIFAAAPPELEMPYPSVERVARESLPQPFGQVLGYVAWLLGVAPPAVVRGDAEGLTSVRVVPSTSEPPVLLVGPAVLSLTDKIGLAFRLGRALAALYPARAQALALASHRLKPFLAAATSLLGLPSSGMNDEETQRIRERLEGFPDLALDVRPIVERLARRSDTINLSRWLRGLTHTAERIGLIACNDLFTAVRMLAEEGVSPTDVIDFALGDELQAARSALGLTVAV